MDVSEIYSRLGTIEGMLDEALRTHKERIEDHEQRITATEKFQWKAYGFIAAWSGFVAVVSTAWGYWKHGK
jgi:hypothetical protein